MNTLDIFFFICKKKKKIKIVHEKNAGTHLMIGLGSAALLFSTESSNWRDVVTGFILVYSNIFIILETFCVLCIPCDDSLLIMVKSLYKRFRKSLFINSKKETVRVGRKKSGFVRLHSNTLRNKMSKSLLKNEWTSLVTFVVKIWK